MEIKNILSRRILAIPLAVWVLIIFARCASIGVMAVGWKAFPKAPWKNSWMVEAGHPFRDHLANFDGAWFIRIAAIGYKKLETGDYDLEAEKKRLRVMDDWGYQDGLKNFGYRHFPLFPYIIRAVQKIIGDWTLAGLIVSNISSFIFLLYLYRLAELELDDKSARWAVAFAALAPNAHYLAALYSEGLMLAGVLGAVYHARRRQWLASLLWGVAASATRFEGAFVFFATFLIYVEQSGGWKAAFRNPRILLASGAPLGVFFPMILFWKLTGSPFAPYIKMRQALGVMASWPWDSLIRDFRYPNPVTLGVDVPVLVLCLTLTWLSARKLSIPLAAFTVTVMLFRLAQPHIAMLRFMMVFFTFNIYLGGLASRRPRLAAALLIISSVLLVFFSTLFINGWWVA